MIETRQISTVKCAACGEERQVENTIIPNGAPFINIHERHPGHGYIGSFNENHFCPKHRIVVIVDGVVFQEIPPRDVPE